MKALIISDTHGNAFAVREILARHSDAEVVLFLGDGLSDVEELAYYDKRRVWYVVRGNCDMRPLFCGEVVEKTLELYLNGRKIIMTHGDLYNAKWGMDSLKELARSRGADIVFFGHTHTPCEEYVSEPHPFYLFNPGSVAYPSQSFGILTLQGGSVLFSVGSIA